MSKVAVIGIIGKSVFLSIDKFGKVGETVTAKNIHVEAGGKGFNQAVAAAKYGAQTDFLAAVNEADVKAYCKDAEKYGVNALFIAKDEQSPYAVITTDSRGDNEVLVYRGATLEEKDVLAFKSKIENADVLLLSNEVPEAVNLLAAKIAKNADTKIILNPAPYRKNGRELTSLIDLFTPNEHEIKGFEELDNVVVTLGDKGCLIRKSGDSMPAVKIAKATDTTGAGDTFNGVLAATTAEGLDLKSACVIANTAAAIEVTRRYVLDAIPSKRDINAYGG